jgi:hypothetical protein
MKLLSALLLPALLSASLAAPAIAQPVVPPAPNAAPAANAQIAHHDRVVARRAARHGNYHKAAVANHAANAAAADANAPH